MFTVSSGDMFHEVQYLQQASAWCSLTGES